MPPLSRTEDLLLLATAKVKSVKHITTLTELTVACSACLWYLYMYVYNKSKVLVAAVTQATLYTFASDVARSCINSAYMYLHV